MIKFKIAFSNFIWEEKKKIKKSGAGIVIGNGRRESGLVVVIEDGRGGQYFVVVVFVGWWRGSGVVVDFVGGGRLFVVGAGGMKGVVVSKRGRGIEIQTKIKNHI